MNAQNPVIGLFYWTLDLGLIASKRNSQMVRSAAKLARRGGRVDAKLTTSTASATRSSTALSLARLSTRARLVDQSLQSRVWVLGDNARVLSINRLVLAYICS